LAPAAGADDVDEMRTRRHRNAGDQVAHHLCGGADLADRLLLDAQAREDRRGHHRRDLARHDLPHQRQHLVVEDLAVVDGALQGLLRRDGHGGYPPSALIQEVAQQPVGRGR
jgi:hypothetical protein